MAYAGDYFRPLTPFSTAAGSENAILNDPVLSSDVLAPLQNLSAVRTKMDSLQRFLSESIRRNTLVSQDEMKMVSKEIVSAVHEIIINGTALISSTQSLNPAGTSIELGFSKSLEPVDRITPAITDSNSSGKGKHVVDLKFELDNCEDNSEIVELDAMELLAEHIHFCEICGKGFKRDANLRMHMRAHGNQYKTLEALAKPYDKFGETSLKPTRFSCPFRGCNRNKGHKKFRPLKSVICVKNHFKRSHCPRMYSCNRCNKKSFSVLADLKSHLKHCGDAKWKCSCGTTFSRKDKLFGHMALFEGHMPAVMVSEEVKLKDAVAVEEDEEEEDEDRMSKETETGAASFNDVLIGGGFFDDVGGFGSIDNYGLQEMLGFPNDVNYGGM